MSREIKFRGFAKKRWFFGGITFFKKTHAYISDTECLASSGQRLASLAKSGKNKPRLRAKTQTLGLSKCLN